MSDMRSGIWLQKFIYLAASYITFGIWGCTYHNYIPGPVPQPQQPKSEPAVIAAEPRQPEPTLIISKSNQLGINGINLPAGKSLNIESGQQSVSFHGLVIRPFSIKHKLTGVETAKFLGCLAFLPICALVKPERSPLPQEQTVRYQEFHCSGGTTFAANSASKYEVTLVNAIDSLPILRISDITTQPYTVVETFIECAPTK